MDYYQHTAGRADALISRIPRPEPAGPAPAHAPALADAGRAWLRAERSSLLAGLRHTNRYAAVISATGDHAHAEALYLEALSLAWEHASSMKKPTRWRAAANATCAAAEPRLAPRT
jgi:hypothetical protein